MDVFDAFAWLATAASSVAGLIALRAGLRRSSFVNALVSALTVIGLCAILALVLTLPFGGPFGAIKIVQYHLAVPPAVLALGVAILGKRPWRFAVSLLLCLPGLVIAHAAFVAPYELVVEHAELPAETETPIRIVVMADLQTDRVGEHERRAVQRALEQEPDLILMPGDLFHGSDRKWNEHVDRFGELISRIDAPFGAYFVEGNTDAPHRLRPFLADKPLRWLDNEVAHVEIRGTTLAIAGLEIRFSSRSADAAIRALVESDADVKILLAHYPDVIFATRASDGIDLIVAGHTHGGQVVIPGFGPPMTLSGVPRSIAAGGLHSLDGRRIYVSRGIGMERGHAPPVRFFCPPELSVLTLRPRSVTAPASTAHRPPRPAPRVRRDRPRSGGSAAATSR